MAKAVSLPEYHEDMLKSYGIADYLARTTVKENLPGVKIAILERGFAGAEEAGNLPPGTLIVNQYDEEMINKYDLNPGYEAPPANEAHGRRVAQLVWAMTGMSYDVAPQLYLLNANGLTNFRRAVRYAIEEKVDIIVYAQNWEYGGNYDGKGFVNAIVDDAIESGITWINAAGNYGRAVYNDSIQTSKEGNLLFNKVSRSQNRDKLFFTMKSDEKDVRVLCVWNDFSDDRDYQALKDLDLYIYEYEGDRLGELVGKSTYAQVAVDPSVNEELSERQQSQLAREEVFLNGLRKDKRYAIVIHNVSNNFSQAKDKIRVIVHANEGVLTFDDHTEGGEIMIPADHRHVISVGDLSESSSSGPTVDFRRKPEVILPPWIREGQTNVYTDIPYAVFSDDVVVAGTSADAAIFGGMAAVLKANKPGITRTELLMIAGRVQAQWRSKQIEVVEPEYTVSESSPMAGTGQPALENRTVIIEREIVTVHSNPFLVGAGFGTGAVIVGAGPVLFPPPIIVINRPVVIPVVRRLPPGPPRPPHAGYHRPPRHPNGDPPRDGREPPGRNGVGEGPRNGHGGDGARINPPGRGEERVRPPSGNLDGRRPETEMDTRPRVGTPQRDTARQPGIADYPRRTVLAPGNQNNLTTPRPAPERMRPFDTVNSPPGRRSAAEMDVPGNNARAQARQRAGRENGANNTSLQQTRTLPENTRVEPSNRTVAQPSHSDLRVRPLNQTRVSPEARTSIPSRTIERQVLPPSRPTAPQTQPDMRMRPSVQNRVTPAVRRPTPVRPAVTPQVTPPSRPAVQPQVTPQVRPSVQNRVTPAVRTPTPARPAVTPQITPPSRPAVQPQVIPQVRPSVQNRVTPAVRTSTPVRPAVTPQVTPPSRPVVQPQPTPQVRPSTPSPAIRQPSSPSIRQSPANRGSGNPTKRR